MENWKGMEITPEIWERVKCLFQSALDLEVEQRPEFLRQSCTDPNIRAEVERLLANDVKASGFLDDPIVGGLDSPLGESRPSLLVGGAVLANRFKIIRFVAEGGMGEVYEAEDLELHERLGIKTLRSEVLQQPNAIERFKREVQLARKVTHPNVCRIFDLYRDKLNGSEVVFVTMEFLRGETLATRIKHRGRMGAKEALPLIAQMASALEAAHKVGVVHRDFKPGNVLLVNGPYGVRAVVTDFGLAFRETNIAGNSQSGSLWHSISAPEIVYGTPAYMAPEQIEGYPATRASDIYALGLVIYEMVTGTRPFKGETPMSAAVKRLVATPTTPREFDPTLSPVWESVILKCLERDPSKRFAGPQDVAGALDKADAQPRPPRGDNESGGAVAASSGTNSENRFRRWAVIVCAGAVVLGLTLSGWWLFFGRSHPLHEADTIVLADFANSTGDAVFDETLKQALATELQQSPFWSLLPDRKVSETLKLMGRSPDQRLDAETTVELCQRAGGKAVLAGSIAAMGSAYVIGLNAVDCQTGSSLAREEVQATRKEDVLNAEGKAATRVREKLGESLRTVQKFDTPLEQATTPSLEALHAYTMGRKELAKDDAATAVPWLQRAIRLDSNFAMAYLSLGISYSVLEENTLAAQSIQKAYGLRERTSEWEKYAIESRYFNSAVGDLREARQIYALWAQTYPQDGIPVSVLGDVDEKLGQYDRAVVEFRQANRLDQGSAFTYDDLVGAYIGLNRLEEARNLIREEQEKKYDSPVLRSELYAIDFLQGDAAGIEQQVAWSAGKPGVEDVLLAMEANTAAYSGHLDKARDLSRRAADSAERAKEDETAAGYQAGAALREALFGNPAQARQLARGALEHSTGRDVNFAAALALAVVGDAVQAKALSDNLARRFPRDTVVQFNYLPAIRGQILVGQNHASTAIEVLQAAAPYELGAMLDAGTVYYALYPVYVRGEAHLAAHQPGLAAAEFQKIIEHRGVVFNEPIGALAHLGLARSYALQGDGVKARAAYQDFLMLWKDADPDIPILKQAKAEYAKLQ
jgi:serine/threonine protein kinase/tetratricopeptide (TPR) repeat protein